jgi:hypothetical protein
MLSAVLFVAATTLSVHTEQARVIVRWASAPDEVASTALGLAYVRPVEQGGSTPAHSYVLANPAEDSLAELQSHPALQSVEMAGNAPMSALKPRLSIERVASYEWLIDWQVQSTILLALATLLAAVSVATRQTVRRLALVGCLGVFVVMALLVPLDSRIHMGDAEQYTASRAGFENVFSDTTVGFESHLSSRLLWWLDRRLGGDEQSPASAMTWLARAATVWFVAMLLVVAASEHFSSRALRYVALALAAPASLMYFGYRELGYLSLTPAAFPLIVQGLRGLRGRIEAGSVLAGLGAALHGFGVLSVTGAAAAALAERSQPWRHRLELAAGATVFATAAYLLWIFVYVVVLKLTVLPGDAGELPWRPFFESAVRGTYVSWALTSVRGAIEVLAAAWMVGVPLIVVALRERNGLVPALAFTIPSLAFLAVVWPIQGLAVEADLLVAAFPAVYALAWVAAQSTTTTTIALVMLAGSHVVFWRVLFSDAFVASRM